jgi:hypothetical protein
LGHDSETYHQLHDWFWGFYEARTEEDLETAGKHFATGFAKGGVFIGELFVTHKAVRFASASSQSTSQCRKSSGAV